MPSRIRSRKIHLEAQRIQLSKFGYNPNNTEQSRKSALAKAFMSISKDSGMTVANVVKVIQLNMSRLSNRVPPGSKQDHALRRDIQGVSKNFNALPKRSRNAVFRGGASKKCKYGYIKNTKRCALPRPRKDFSLRAFGYAVHNSPANRRNALNTAVAFIMTAKGLPKRQAQVMVSRRLNLVRNLTKNPQNKAAMSADVQYLKVTPIRGGGLGNFIGQRLLSKGNKLALSRVKAARVLDIKAITDVIDKGVPQKKGGSVKTMIGRRMVSKPDQLFLRKLRAAALLDHEVVFRKRASPKRITPKAATPKYSPKVVTPKKASPKRITPKAATPKYSPKAVTPKKASPVSKSPFAGSLPPPLTGGCHPTYMMGGRHSVIGVY